MYSLSFAEQRDRRPKLGYKATIFPPPFNTKAFNSLFAALFFASDYKYHAVKSQTPIET
jgi:hypothetical protein